MATETKKFTSVGECLNHIQTNLNAPKNLFNKFGNYRYRSAESILEAVKPLLKETGCFLLINDSIEQVGERIYVKASATLQYENNSITATAYARESEDKKGMDASQVTGATSSYARKYALNGLFAIDDAKDTDTEEYQSAGGNQTNLNELVTAINTAKNAKTKEELDNIMLPFAINAAKNAKTKDALGNVWRTFANLQNNAEFKALVVELGKKLK